jgi:hypothetical protein
MNRTIGVDLAGTSYVFSPDAANSGTVTISGVALRLEQIKLITNATRNTIIYNWADASVGAFGFQQVNATTCELTLAANTSTHDPADRLDIIVNVDSATNVSTGELMEAIEALRFTVASLTRTVGLIRTDVLGRAVALVEQPTAANCNVTATLSSGTLTNAAQFGGLAANDLIPITSRLGGDNLRLNISVT